MSIIYDRIRIIFDRVAKEYYHLKKQRRDELYGDYGIDSATDYARYILEEVAYDKDGGSLY